MLGYMSFHNICFAGASTIDSYPGLPMDSLAGLYLTIFEDSVDPAW
jgi:hypothetical protein